MLNKYFFWGSCFWGIIIIMLYILRSKSRVHIDTIEEFEHKKVVITLIVMIATILLCIMPMGLAPKWNGEIPDHRNQYELMAQSILDGHLYIDYDVDPILLKMENPYDPIARDELGVEYHYDHAFYNGCYYMYFGIVPVILLFLPYHLITGMDLATFHATQIFVSFFICGVFATFYMLARKFFDKMSFVMYLFLSVAFAIMSTWYSIDAPALYCTAITAGLCMEIWSLFFFIKAVYMEENDKRSICFAFIGSLLGSLAFGCRPPIALANLLVIPMLVEYIRRRNFNFKLFGQLVFAATPYIIVGVMLMIYNYVRFDNPFEFGQSYQLTGHNQSSYVNLGLSINLIRTVNGVLQNFVHYQPISEEFPYISVNNSIFLNFPILLFSIIGLTWEGVRTEIRKNHLVFFVFAGMLLPLLITIVDVTYSPGLQERYRMDIYWLMGLMTFIVIGFCNTCLSAEAQRKFSHKMTVWALVTIFMCFWLFIVPHDSNYTAYVSGALLRFKRVILLGTNM